ncbi:MAG: bifunctional 5,10-methylenetetrahydrofolate dehydrogenase/5,10-methenyltetrahydrofolate cyclohydrolase [Anaerolineales bacterium]
MTAKILDGRATAKAIEQEIAKDVEDFEKAHGWAPGIAVIQLGEDPAAAWYVRQIKRHFIDAGMRFALHTLAETTDQETLAARMEELNGNPRTNGVIVQLPLPDHLSQEAVVNMLDPAKDVDGMHPLNAGRLMQQRENALIPATPAGGMELLRRYDIPLKGARAVMVGRSNIVGRPMALLMLHQHATVTICHSRTEDLAAITRQADILAVAVGKPGMIGGDMIRPGAVVIDYGVNVIDDELFGDVDTEAAKEVAAYLTPVPGGTGPMTNAMLMRNTVIAARRQTAESAL